VREVALAQVAATVTGVGQAVPDPESTKPLGVAAAEYLKMSKNLKAGIRANYRTGLFYVAIPFFGAEKTLGEITQAEFARYAAHVDALDKAHSTKELYAFISHLSEQKGIADRDIALLAGHGAGTITGDRYNKLRDDPVYLFDLVTQHLGAYEAMLAAALEAVPPVVAKRPRGRPRLAEKRGSRTEATGAQPSSVQVPGGQ
jgi:hypothetical protein